MKKTLIIVGIVIVVIVAGLGIAYQVMINSTKSHSPEETVKYSKNGANLEVFYNRPFKKGRVIFGELVPYDETWRTGANEATTFETDKDLSIAGKTLKAGKYTLWTVPGEINWEVVFNSKMYDWGVDFSQKSLRETEHDALVITVPVQKENQTTEQFTISFQELGSGAEMILAWDNVSIPVNINF